MSCFFSAIRKLESSSVLNGNEKYEIKVDVFALTKAQKAIGITLIVLAIIILIVGASLNHSNQKIAQIMMGTGSGIAIVTSIPLLVIHLLFKNKINNHFAGLLQKIDFTVSAGFPPKNLAVFQNVGDWYGRSFRDDKICHLACYQTRQIHNENFDMQVDL